jgi:hypothetical protein
MGIEKLAATVQSWIRQHRGGGPSLTEMEAIFEALYLASLRADEHNPVRCTVSFVPFDRREPTEDFEDEGRVFELPPVSSDWRVTEFGAPIPMTATALAKLSRAADPYVSHIAVCATPKGPVMWGLIDQIQSQVRFQNHEADAGGGRRVGSFSAAIVGIGELRVFSGWYGIASLRNGQVMGAPIDIFVPGPIAEKLRPHARRHVDRVQASFGEPTWSRMFAEYDWWHSIEDQWYVAVIRMLLTIQRYAHGGALLVVPEGRSTDLHLTYPFRYDRVTTALRVYGSTHVFERLQADESPAVPPHAPFEETGPFAGEELEGALRLVASLSRVDGAVLLDQDLTVHGFGVEIATLTEPSSVLRVTDEDATRELCEAVPVREYGTRHRSMIRYCAAHRDAVGFVVSQDRDIRVMTNLDGEVGVWENPNLLMLSHDSPEYPWWRITDKT